MSATIKRLAAPALILAATAAEAALFLAAQAVTGIATASVAVPALDDMHRPHPASVEPSLEEVRAATERFRDVEVALAEGYIRDPADMCETAEMMGRPREEGAMGIHYFRPDMLGITAPPNPRVDGTGTHTDFLNRAILLYEPQADGSLELVAVENLVFAKAWSAAGNAAPPSFQGVAYDTMVDDPGTSIDEAHNFEPHHDRHVWLYRENPSGPFEQFNPNVTCEHHGSDGRHQASVHP